MLRQMQQRFILRLPLDVAVLPVMRDRVRSFLSDDEVDGDFVEDVVLCIQEACKNAIRFSRSPDGIFIRLTREPGSLYVIVRDHGVGVAPSRLNVTPTPTAEHGRGLQIIRCLMDEVDVRVRRGTELRMVKRVPRFRQSDGDSSIAMCA